MLHLQTKHRLTYAAGGFVRNYRMVVSQSRGTPICFNAYDWDPQRGTTDFANLPCFVMQEEIQFHGVGCVFVECVCGLGLGGKALATFII